MENVQGTYKLTKKSIRFSLIVGICCMLKEKYYELEGKDSITIYIKEGKLGIPWLIPQ